MDVNKVTGAMVTAAVGGLVVKSVIDEANFTGVAGTIAGLFVFALLAAVLIFALTQATKGK